MLPRDTDDLFGPADNPPLPRAESVSDFTRRAKRLLETRFSVVSLRGEISNLRAQSSGHIYFSLKDADAQISVVLFRSVALRLGVALRDGLQIIATGSISLWEPRGQYQLIARHITEDGFGRLQQEFELLKQRLAAEGLFDADRKKPIPRFPRQIGIVTSPSGAALQDFLKILRRRAWTGSITVFPAKVQGAGAAAEIAAQIAAANNHPGLDLLVVTRGGGSLEDLWAFNEETVARAVAASHLPVLSAVGHEIDFSLCDFAADRRAETPSAAAEMISSGYLELVEKHRRLSQALHAAAERQLVARRERVLSAKTRLRLLSPSAQIERHILRLDDFRNRLDAAADRALAERRHAYKNLAAALKARSPELRVQTESHRLLSLHKRLEAASPRSILNRGFVIIRDAANNPVTRRSTAAQLPSLNIEFADGVLPASPEKTS